jgi:hypothetical protein
MMHDQSLPMIMWEEVSMETIYIHNKSFHQILKNVTLEEAFTRVNPKVGNFRIFGFPVYFHVPKDNSFKLYPSGIKGTFVGYSEYSKHTRSTSMVRDRLR